MNKLVPALAAVCLLIASAAFGAGVSQAKIASVGALVSADGVVTQVDGGECYIESEDRSAGIWVTGPTGGLNVGDVVAVAGTREVAGGEACITGATITPQGREAEIFPFSMNNRAIGGSSPAGSIYDYLQVGGRLEWTKAGGAPNTGLLVKTWGTVKSTYFSPTTGDRWFYMDDGSKPVSDYGDTGVLVYSEARVEQRDFVAVTGISSVEPSFDDARRLVRVVRTRDLGDIATVTKYQKPEYPFSDEFSGTVLDARWIVLRGDGEASLTTSPGWLTLTAPEPTAYLPNMYSPALSQYLAGDWDVELKVRVELNAAETSRHEVRILMQTTPVSQSATTPTTALSLAAVRLSYPGGDSYVELGRYVPTVPMPGDTCYFRFSRRHEAILANVSFDGVTYQPKDVVIGPVTYNYLGLYLSSTIYTAAATPFTAHVDYFRYNRALGGF